MTFNELNIQHSRNIGDTVASASTDGNLFTSNQRVAHLNRAISSFLIYAYSKDLIDALQGYIGETLYTLSNYAADTSASNIWKILSVGRYDATTTAVDKVVFEINNQARFYLAAGSNSFLDDDYYWFWDGTDKIRFINTGSTDQVYIRYIKEHTDLVVGGTILIPPQYQNLILDIALIEASYELGNDTAINKIQTKLQLVDKTLQDASK